MSATTADADGIEDAWPPCGPCACCGGPDKRHRVWDMIVGRWLAGDSVEVLADDYDASVLAIESLLRVALSSKRRKPIEKLLAEARKR